MKMMNTPRPESRILSVSLVVYQPDLAQLGETIATLAIACETLRTERSDTTIEFALIDNGGLPAHVPQLDLLRAQGVVVTVLSGHGNVGYGRGHNFAIEQTASRYHLVLNPDINLASNALSLALRFLEEHPEAGLLTPWIGDEAGAQQFLCRRYPTFLDLLLRGFAPSGVRRLFARRLDRYEMRDVINEADIVWDPPIVSGCFMLFRTAVLKQLGGFDPRYFLYFEDYDLSLRAHRSTRVVYTPHVRVLHHGGGAARKGSKHIRMFAASAYRFFHRFGWKWL